MPGVGCFSMARLPILSPGTQMIGSEPKMSDTTEPTTTAPGEGATTSLDPVKLAYMIADYDRMTARVEELERRVRDSAAVDARRSSIDLSAKAGSWGLKFYLDPFVCSAENDRALAEICRLYYLSHGVWPEGCTQPVIDLARLMMTEAESKMQGGA